MATEYTDRDEIWHVSVDLGFTLGHKIWPSSVKGGRYMSPPNVEICPELWFFGHRKPTQRTRSDEIWRVSVDHMCTVSYQIWPGSVREHCCYKNSPGM